MSLENCPMEAWRMLPSIKTTSLSIYLPSSTADAWSLRKEGQDCTLLPKMHNVLRYSKKPLIQRRIERELAFPQFVK